MGPPPPITDKALTWMVGEWEGSTTGTMGGSKDKMSGRMGLNGQFLMMQYDADMGEGGAMTGMAAITFNQEGGLVGYWIDTNRTMAHGTGKIEGNKMTIVWKGPMGDYTRVTEKISDDEYKVHGYVTMPDGSKMEASSVMKRVKKS